MTGQNCSGIPLNIPQEPFNGIPNPSFEQHSGNPTLYSQMIKCHFWNDLDRSSDFFHDPSYMANGSLGSPNNAQDGSYYVGFWNKAVNASDEFFGVCLTEPLYQNTQYDFTFNVFTGTSNQGNADVLNLTLYAKTNCTNDGTQICSSWDVLGQAIVQYSNQWQSINISFSAPNSYQTIAIGPSCTNNSNSGYYYIDNISATKQVHSDAAIALSLSGDYCSNNQSLNVSSNASYSSIEWYKDGALISSANGSTYNLSTSETGSYYAIIYDQNSNCLQSQTQTINSINCNQNGHGSNGNTGQNGSGFGTQNPNPAPEPNPNPNPSPNPMPAPTPSEDCINGIDDDGDGLIDLNDNDCSCNLSNSQNLLSDPSFEEYVTCPVNEQDFKHSIDQWVEVTDFNYIEYYNSCGFMNINQTSAIPANPYGEGFIGVKSYGHKNEYFGQCLASDLIAGNTYEFSITACNPDGDSSMWPAAFGPFPNSISYDLALYGNASCINHPYNSDDCPEDQGQGWQELGRVLIIKDNNWNSYTFSFTPSQNISAIAIGGACDMPSNQEIYTYFDSVSIVSISNSLPQSSIQSSGEFCNANVNIFTQNIADAYQWYQSGIALNGETSSTLNLNPGQSGDFQLMITHSGNCAISDSIVIEQDSLSYSIITTDATCGQSNGSVYIPNDKYASIAIDGNWHIVDSVDGLAPNTYDLYIDGGALCKDTTTFTIQSASNASIQITVDSNQATIEHNSSAPPIQFYLDSVLQTDSIFENLAPGMYLGHIQDANGCISADSFEILAPTLPPSINCNLNFAHQIDSNQVALMHSSIHHTVLFYLDGIVQTDSVFENLANGNYEIHLTDTLGCSDTAQITINHTPNNNPPQNNCNTSISVLVDSSSITIAHLNATEPINYFIDANSVGSNATHHNLTNGQHEVSIIDANGCSDTQLITISVPPINCPEIVLDIEASTCADIGQNTFTASAQQGSAPYQFYINNQAVSIPYAYNLDQDSLSFEVFVLDQNYCSSDTIMYTVYAHPTFEIDLELDSLCAPVCTTLQSIDHSTQPYISEIKSSVMGSIYNAQQEICLNQAGRYTIDYQIIATSGCSSIIQKEIQVHTQPNANFFISPSNSVEQDDLVDFQNNSSDYTRLYWSIDDEDFSIFENPNEIFEDSGNYIVKLIVENELGCIDSISKGVQVRPKSTLFIPDAFSPNADGNNDAFGPKHLEVDEDFYSFTILNRWGEEVFHTNNPNELWNGTSKEKVCQPDIYLYILTFKHKYGNRQRIEGRVSLIR